MVSNGYLHRTDGPAHIQSNGDEIALMVQRIYNLKMRKGGIKMDIYIARMVQHIYNLMVTVHGIKMDIYIEKMAQPL
jgi:hypothetical protein